MRIKTFFANIGACIVLGLFALWMLAIYLSPFLKMYLERSEREKKHQENLEWIKKAGRSY